MKKYSQSSDEKTLIERLVKGDDSAFETLFNSYWDQVYSFALLMTKSIESAQDISQQVFIAIFTQREKMSGVTNFRAYLFQIAKFKVLFLLRRKKAEKTYLEFLSRQVNWQELSADTTIQQKNLNDAILQGISLLPRQQRTAFKLSRIEGLSHEQVSITMGVSKKTVKDYIVRGIAFLRKHLRDQGLYLVFTGVILTF